MRFKLYCTIGCMLLAASTVHAQGLETTGAIFSGLGVGNAAILQSGDTFQLGDTATISVETQNNTAADLQAIDDEIAFLEAFINGFQPMQVVEFLQVTQQEMLGFGRTGCFLADTLVTMADGSQQRIEDIAEGQQVLSWSPDGTPAIGTVLARVETPDKEILDIDGIRATPEHRFRLADGTMKPASALRVGDILAGSDGDVGKAIASIEPLAGTHPVHNLIVHPHNTFVAEGVQVGGYDATGITGLTQ